MCAFKVVLKPNNLVKSNKQMCSPKSGYLKGLSLSFHEKRGLLIWRWQNKGPTVAKKEGGGHSFKIDTQAQRVSALPGWSCSQQSLLLAGGRLQLHPVAGIWDAWISIT